MVQAVIKSMHCLAVGPGAGENLTAGRFNILVGKDAGAHLTTESFRIIVTDWSMFFSAHMWEAVKMSFRPGYDPPWYLRAKWAVTLWLFAPFQERCGVWRSHAVMRKWSSAPDPAWSDKPVRAVTEWVLNVHGMAEMGPGLYWMRRMADAAARDQVALDAIRAKYEL